MKTPQLNQMGSLAMRNKYACQICGSSLERNRRYLAPGGENLIRDFVYLLPAWAVEGMASINARLRGKLNSVITNRKFFGQRDLYWCPNCRTGFALPLFEEAELSSYYKEFYWTGREQHDEYFNATLALPRESRLSWVRSQLDWIASHGVDFTTAIDFGAGDCAGAYLMSKKCSAKNVCVVDSSIQAQSVARSYGISYFQSLNEAPQCELLYGSHSIEHVADLVGAFKILEEKVCEGGYVFLETPNIADKQVFEGLVMTPHTFMLSQDSFNEISKISKLKLIAVEAFGPPWSKNHNIASQARADLRVIFRKEST